MARLYTNENFPIPVVEELRRWGHDVLTVQEAGNAGQAIPDEAVLAFAVAEDRALVTLNRKHFLRLHAQDSSHPGIVVCTFDPDFVRQALRIHEALGEQAELAGQVVRVNRPPPLEGPA
jgi:predicted nuclease of predicted toxin-antitoxin system